MAKTSHELSIEFAVGKFLEEIDPELRSQIEKKMPEAEGLINYSFKNIKYLMRAFCRAKTETKAETETNESTKKSYENDTLAQIGDAVLDLVIAEDGFSKGKQKKEIDKDRQEKASNEHLSEILKSMGLRPFCYNKEFFYDKSPKEKQVSSGKHDAIIEAIIGAIYLDGGLEKAKEWILESIINKKS